MSTSLSCRVACIKAPFPIAVGEASRVDSAGIAFEIFTTADVVASNVPVRELLQNLPRERRLAAEYDRGILTGRHLPAHQIDPVEIRIVDVQPQRIVGHDFHSMYLADRLRFHFCFSILSCFRFGICPRMLAATKGRKQRY